MLHRLHVGVTSLHLHIQVMTLKPNEKFTIMSQTQTCTVMDELHDFMVVRHLLKEVLKVNHE